MSFICSLLIPISLQSFWDTFKYMILNILKPPLDLSHVDNQRSQKCNGNKQTKSQLLQLRCRFLGGACLGVARGSTSMVNGNAFPMLRGTQSIVWLLKEQATFFKNRGII